VHRQVLKGLELLPATSISSNGSQLAATDIAIIDTKILSLLKVNVGAELLPKIIDTYLSEGSAKVDAITAAAARGECDLVAKEAHPLKSSSAYLGAMSLAELASQLEHAGREHDLEKILQEVLHLPSLSEQTLEELLRIDIGGPLDPME
jgi:HPt (histidine-containing phosphotransfer) domain-containing protein